MVIITQGDQPVVVAYGRSNYICLFHCSIEFRILISSWIACIFISIFNHIFGLKKNPQKQLSLCYNLDEKK